MTDALTHLQQRHLEALENRYATTLAALGYDGVLIHSGKPTLHFGDDQHASFCSYGHFQHWTGQADLPYSWLLIRPGQRPVCFFHAPDDFWHLPPRLPDQAWTEHFEVVTGRYETPPPLGSGRFAVIGDVAEGDAKALSVERNAPALLAALDEGRVHKSEYELACLSEANRMAMCGHRAAKDVFLAGGSEFDVQLAYLQASRQRESELPYGNIVGFGPHAAVLHYQHCESQPPHRRHSLLMDAGHRYRGYCADITRTWSGPDSDPLYATLIAHVHEIERELASAVAPGVEFIALHERMHRLLGELLVESGLVSCSAEAAVEAGITRAFCPHGLGHLLGVQVHDVAGRMARDGTPLPPPPQHPALRLTRELEAGMVVTIEPGLYFIPMLLKPLEADSVGRNVNWPQVERLAPHGGIRIEDNVAVTADSPRNLTAEIE